MTDDIDDLIADANRGPRVMLFDLERIPGRLVLDMWEPGDVKRLNWIHPDRWEQTPDLLCGSWMTYGARKVEFVASWDNPDDPYHVARTFADAVGQVDAVCGYNHLRADWPWLKTDWLKANIPPPPPVKHLDLYRVVRRHFSFESKSLRYVTEQLGLPTKSGHYDAGEARRAAAGDEKARRSMTRYNKQDTRALGPLLDRLRAYLPTTVNLGIGLTDEKLCPYCGSDEIRRDGWYAASVQSYAQWRCDRCGGWSRSNIVKARASLRGVTV